MVPRNTNLLLLVCLVVTLLQQQSVLGRGCNNNDRHLTRRPLLVPQSFIRAVPRGGALVLTPEEKEVTQEETELPSEEKGTEESSSDNNVEEKNDEENTNAKYNFSLYQDNDGSDEDEDKIPGRYLRMQKGDRVKAKSALQETLNWREEKEVDTILCRPHSSYDVCKEFQPHYFLGTDIADHIIFVQRPGFTRWELVEKMNPDDLLKHYCYVMEYCWNVLNEERQKGSSDKKITTMTAILDLSKIRLSKTRDMLYFVRQYVSMMSHHYPQRSYKTLIINSPTWFATIFNLISPLLRESTRQKITICSSSSKKQREIMEEVLGKDKDGIEDLITGSNDYLSSNWKELEMEQELRTFCLARLKEHGEEMKPIPEIEPPAKRSKKSFFSRSS